MLHRTAQIGSVHSHKRRLHGLGDLPAVGKFPADGRKLLLLPRADGRIFDLLDLKPQKIRLPLSRLLIQMEARKLLSEGLIFPVAFLHVSFQIFRFIPGIFVQDLQMLLLMEKGLMLMLSMNVQEKSGDGLKPCGGHRLVVDPADRPGRGDLFRNDKEAVLIGRDVQGLQSVFFLLIVHGKGQLHQGAVLALADHVLRRLSSQRQTHRSDEDGFSCSGLSGQYIKPSGKLHLGLFDQGQVFYV